MNLHYNLGYLIDMNEYINKKIELKIGVVLILLILLISNKR